MGPITKTDDRYIRGLLDRWADGETTDREEEILRRYFTSRTEIPADMRWAEALFGFFTSAAGETTMGTAPAPSNDPVEQDPAETPGQEPAVPLRRNRGLVMRRFAAVAACAAAVALVTTLMFNRDIAGEQQVLCWVNGQPVDDPEEAAIYAGYAIEYLDDLLSRPAEVLSQLNQAVAPLDNLARIIQKMENPDNAITQD